MSILFDCHQPLSPIPRGWERAGASRRTTPNSLKTVTSCNVGYFLFKTIRLYIATGSRTISPRTKSPRTISPRTMSWGYCPGRYCSGGYCPDTIVTTTNPPPPQYIREPHSPGVKKGREQADELLIRSCQSVTSEQFWLLVVKKQ